MGRTHSKDSWFTVRNLRYLEILALSLLALIPLEISGESNLHPDDHPLHVDGSEAHSRQKRFIYFNTQSPVDIGLLITIPLSFALPTFNLKTSRRFSRSADGTLDLTSNMTLDEIFPVDSYDEPAYASELNKMSTYFTILEKNYSSLSPPLFEIRGLNPCYREQEITCPEHRTLLAVVNGKGPSALELGLRGLKGALPLTFKINEDICQQRVLCEVFAEPDKFKPVTDIFMRKLTVDRGPVVEKPDSRYYRYMKAMQDGITSGVESCAKAFKACPYSATERLNMPALHFWTYLTSILKMEFRDE